MEISKNGLIELANYEALSHTKYLDSVGVETIGIGMTRSEIPDLHSWSWDRELSTKECVDLFVEAIKKYEDAVNDVLEVDVSQNQFDALVSITYNIGIGGMKGSTFMKRLNAGYPPESIVTAMESWNKGGGHIIKGLTNRRAAEGKIFISGDYTNDGTVGLIKVNSEHKEIDSGRINIGEYL